MVLLIFAEGEVDREQLVQINLDVQDDTSKKYQTSSSIGLVVLR